MLFNSIEFLLFLPTVFYLYWFVFQKNLKIQNLLLLISSYVFYGWWDWRFLSLIFLSTIVDYFVGFKIYDSKKINVKRLYLWVSIFFNLSLLGFFKYFNFFIDSWVDLLCAFGYESQNIWTLNVILPVGISFYTFQTMSYSLDIYFKKLKPTKDFISFASFVSFFPQLVAGPIERASNLLPQILNKRVFKYDQGVQGLRLILWGMFKKIVIADSLAWRVDYVFNDYQNFDGGVLLLSLIYFSFQIYCDFSGYSDIAIGTSNLFGFKLMSNFKFPYFSRNIGEFWRRWHISLSTWFRDYLYIQLGGSKGHKWQSIRNIFIVFIVSGFWHGANWTFIIWGLIHAMLYIPLFLRGKHKKHTLTTVAENSLIPNVIEMVQMGITFFSTMIAWVFFRSENISSAIDYLLIMITEIGFPSDNRNGSFFVLIILFFDWFMRKDEKNVLKFEFLFKIFNQRRYVTMFSYLIYYAFFLSTVIFYFLKKDKFEFIYFQF